MNHLRHLRFSILLACLLGAICSPVSGQTPDSAPFIWLHAWVPETGTIADSTNPLEKSLAQVADLALRGNFRKALSELGSIKSADPAAGYLIRIFRREILLRSTLAIGGIADVQSEGGLLLVRNVQEGARLTQDAAQLAHQAGPLHEQQLNAANRIADFFDSCAIQMVSQLRSNQISHETAELAALADSPNSASPQAVDPHLACALKSFELKESPVVDPVSAQLLELLVEARYEEGHWNFSEANDYLVKGLALARSEVPSVAGLWLLALGDLEIAPYGSPLTFGFDSSSDAGVRAAMGAGVFSKALTVPTADAITRAEDDYRQSNRPEAEVAIRKAYIAWLRMGRNAAPAYAGAAIAAGSDYPALRALSLASRSFLLADRQYFDAGLHIAKDCSFSGLAISLVDMAESVSSRLVTTDPIRAVAVLDFAAQGAVQDALPASAARLELSLAFYNDAMHRSDFAIDAWERAVVHIKEWTVETDRTVNQEHLNSVLLPAAILAQRQRLLGVLVQLAAALNQKYFDEGREEWRTRRDHYEAEARQVLPDTNEMAHQEWTQYLKSRDEYAALATQVATLRRGGCDAAKDIFLRQKENAPPSSLSWVPFSAIASSCDPTLRADVLDGLMAYDPISALKAAVEISAKKPGFAAAEQLHLAVINLGIYFDALVALGDGTTLLNRTDQLSALVQSNSSIIGRIGPYVELYRAIALGLEGRNTESRDLLINLRRTATSANADPSFRRRVNAVLIEAEAALQDAGTSLIVLQSLQVEVHKLQTLTSGVIANDPDSVRLAMLLRQQAISEIPLKQQQEIAALEKRLLPAAVSAGVGVGEITAITDRIPTGAVVLVYYPARTNMLIWRLEKGRPPLLRRSKAAPWVISLMAADLSRKLLDVVAGWEGPATNLYHELVEPVGPLNPGSTLAIWGMPYLSFDLLGPSVGRPLIQDHPILYLADLVSPEGATVTTGTRAVVAGAMGAGLDQVEPEVRDVARLLHAKPLFGLEATVSRLQTALPSARFVHIASHGVIDSANPYRSYLALTDGNLEAWELFHSSPKADLVVFSACDTLRPIPRSIADDPTTIGSLTTLGGAPRVLSSLWAADDRDARQLMTLFYQGLETNPAVSLQKAKIALGQLHRSANFVLTVASPSAIVLRWPP